MVLPAGIVSSGVPSVRRTCQEIGLDFDPWQVGTAKCILGKQESGLYAADTVVLSIPRQVGKTFLVGLLVFADSIIHPDTTTVWTAHRFKVARETFNELKGIALSDPLAPHIDPDDIYTAAGNESITFRNGSRIVFAARERGAIRGFTKVRRLVLDEAQILSEAAMSDLAPTQNQAVNPQIILMGTPPKPTDPGETFANLRHEALTGQSEGVVYVEFSADEDCDIDDVEAWETANPSLHTRTPVAAIRRLRKLLSNDDDFRREALGIWPPADEADPWGVVSRAAWVQRCGPRPESGWLDGPVTLSVEADQDLTVTSVCVAGACGDQIGAALVGRLRYEPGGPAIIDQVIAASSDPQRPVAHVVIDPRSPAGALIADLSDAGITVLEPTTQDVVKATGHLRTLFNEGGIEVRESSELTAAASVAKLRKAGESSVIDRWAKRDASPLIGLNLAVWGHLNQPAAEPPGFAMILGGS